MKYFVIKWKDPDPVVDKDFDNIAVVFHDYKIGTFHCRSKVESFLRAFDAVCQKSDIQLVKDEKSDILRAVYKGPKGYNWIDPILDQLCGDYWYVGDTGDIPNTEFNIDSTLEQFLS